MYALRNTRSWMLRDEEKNITRRKNSKLISKNYFECGTSTSKQTRLELGTKTKINIDYERNTDEFQMIFRLKFLCVCVIPSTSVHTFRCWNFNRFGNHTNNQIKNLTWKLFRSCSFAHDSHPHRPTIIHRSIDNFTQIIFGSFLTGLAEPKKYTWTYFEIKKRKHKCLGFVMVVHLKQNINCPPILPPPIYLAPFSFIACRHSHSKRSTISTDECAMNTNWIKCERWQTNDENRN